MSSLAKPLCALFGHRRARRRVWNDHVDLRASCIRCGTALIRTPDKGWRPFTASDERPDRISREAYREQLKSEDDLSGINADHPERWADRLVDAFAGPARRIDAAGLFDRLLDDLARDPAFAAAVASGRLDGDARHAVGGTMVRALGAERTPPSHLVDPLARYLHARAQDRAAVAITGDSAAA